MKGTKMIKNLSLLLLVLNGYISAQEFTDLYGDYLGQTPPGDTPVVFASGIVSTDDLEHSAPSFSPDGRRAYFDSREDIWVVEKQGDNWIEPRCLGITSRFPELKAVFVSSVTRTGTLYFMGFTSGPLNDRGIYRAELVNGEYTKPQLLPRSINMPPFLNWTPFIAPDGRYLFFVHLNPNAQQCDVWWVENPFSDPARR
jgi:hypothetical protein